METRNTDNGNFRNYAKTMLGIVASSFAALGILLGIVILIMDSAKFQFEGTVEVERLDALWTVIGLPLVAVLLFGLLSPVSYAICRLFVRR